MPPSSFILLLFARGMASRKGNIPFANKRKACPKGTKAIHAQQSLKSADIPPALVQMAGVQRAQRPLGPPLEGRI